MMQVIAKPYEKRFFFALIIIVVLATLFWTGSRYPALDEKAMMSGAIQLEDALSFEAKFPITADMGLIERIFWSTLNWVNTNKKGMTFGILFAAAFLTAVGYLKQRSFRSGWANSLLGLVIGTPLGVCVNCAAPIARGMYSGGMRAETVLSAMIASPTLNVVVLTLAFSLLPFYMVVAKIGLSLVLILGVVPLICRLLPADQVAPQPSVSVPQPWSTTELGQSSSEPFLQALAAVSRAFAANLWYILKMTAPLMLLAGFLGTLAATLLPLDLITGLPFGLMVLVMIAAVGLFLPVPIAFDVVVCGMLIGLGLTQGYVMALLFTLGSFSIYSFFIVAQAVSLRAANLLCLAVLVLGVIAGAAVHSYHQWQSERALEILLGRTDTAPSPGLWAAQAATTEPVLITVTSTDADRITVTSTPLVARSPAGDTPFTRIEANTVGIDKPLEFSFADMWPPFWEGRSLSSGDIDRDGDLDLVIASTRQGLYIYNNTGTGQFQRAPLDLGTVTDLPVFNAALVDINNDQWPDLFITTYRQGNFLLINHDGRFDTVPPQPVGNRADAVLSLALAFDDVNADGNLDVALGNWAAGWYRRIPGEESRNRIVFGQDGHLTGDHFLDLPGIPGETLSILFSDINQDGHADLLVGNDFEVPDYFYHGDGRGELQMVTHQDGLIPHTTTTTMALKTADLQNDGSPEIYLAQIAGRSSGVSEVLKMQPLAQYCDQIRDPQDKQSCARNMEIKAWYKSGNNFDPTYASRCQDLSDPDHAECKAMLVKDLAIQRRDPSICALIPKAQPRARSYCDIHFLPARPITQAEANAAIAQILRSNVLLEKSDLVYADSAYARNLQVGGWSWDTKIADFDNDGWQDIYIVNGTWVPNEVSPSNLFFHNTGTGSFTESSGPFGLEDYLMTAAATRFDFDNDGDLDLVTHTVNGPLMVFRNNNQQNNSINFELADEQGNSQGLGARLQITTLDGTIQTREVQLGGGFMSFDAPRVHFGLGTASAIQSLEIRWRTGAVTRIEGGLSAGTLYRVHRSLASP